jgi:hypothetical protein
MVAGLEPGSGIPRKGYAFDGIRVQSGVFQVARVRWTWDVLRARHEPFTGIELPSIDQNEQLAALMTRPVQPNEAVDLDLVISYGEPYWPGGGRSARDNARLGPLRNGAGMALTGAMTRRWQAAHSTPRGLLVPKPGPGEEPNRILAGGPGDDPPNDLYWFVESATSRATLEASQAAWLAQRSTK